MLGLTERRWPQIIQSLVADGTVQGLVTVADTIGFYVNQHVVLISSTQDSTHYKVKRVISPSQLYVGSPSKSIDNREDVSRFLAVDGAQLIAHEQDRPGIQSEYIMRQVYAEEPVIALRTLPVDPYGRPTYGQMQLANPIIKKPYDYILAAYPNPVTEQYTFLTGGIGGTPVALVTVTYTDATKALISTVDVGNY